MFIWVTAKHKDGHLFPIKISMRSVNIEGQPMILACIRDTIHPTTINTPLPVGWEHHHDPVISFTWEYIDNNFIMIGYNNPAVEFFNDNISLLISKSVTEIFSDRTDIIDDLKKCYHDKTVFKKRMQFHRYALGVKKEIDITYVYLPPNLVVTNFEESSENSDISNIRSKDDDSWRTQYERIPLPSLRWQKKDNDYLLVDYNFAANELYNGLISGYVGKSVNLFFNDPNFIDALNHCANGEDIGKLEIACKLPPKSTLRHILCSFNYAPPNLILTHLEDVTLHRKAEEGLKKTKRDLRVLTQKLIKAEDNERKRIAHELHDSLGQSLTAIKYTTEGIINRMILEGQSDKHVDMLKSLIPKIQQAVKEVREISVSLQPTMLDDLGVMETIYWFCKEYEHTYSDIHVNVEINADENNIPDSLKTTIFRVLQEAMNNVAKHSRADYLHVLFMTQDDSITLTIEDNGMGFDVESAFSKGRRKRGFGIDSMKNRVELSGGLLILESDVGKGTSVKAAWNL